MPANTNPIFSDTPNVNGCLITAALTKSNGDGTIATDIFKAFTAGADGAYVSKVRFSPCATTAATATTATVGRAYLSSQTSGATTGGTNTWLLGEVALPAQTADHSTNPTSPIEIPIGFAIPAGYTILVSTHAAPAANTQIEALVIGGDY
jgi:FlaG/FlaF family flagellin (archaellin)